MSSIGKLTGIYLGAQRGESKTPCASAQLIADHGVQGDSHAGTHPQRHVSLFAQEILQAIQSEGFNLTPGELSANLFTEGLPLDALAPGTQLRIGTAVIEIVEPRKPCRSITRISHRLPKRLYGQCGQLARVLKGGMAQTGDAIEILDQPASQPEPRKQANHAG
jgi:MOSC domain-containing protein YiiM